MLRASSRFDAVTVYQDWNGLLLYRVTIHGDTSFVVGPVDGAPELDDYDNIDDLLEALRGWALKPT